MALPGETTGGKLEIVCNECGKKLPLHVCHSGGGYYLGYGLCCEGSMGRATRYMTKSRAESELAYLKEHGICVSLR